MFDVVQFRLQGNANKWSQWMMDQLVCVCVCMNNVNVHSNTYAFMCVGGFG